jgi:hypothetical protein
VGTVAGSYIYVGQGTNVDFILRTNSNNIYTIIFDNYASTTSYKSFITYGTMINSGNNQRPGFSAGAYETTTAITSLTFSNSGGHFSAGTVLLYGVK